MKLDRKPNDQSNWLDRCKNNFGNERKLTGYKFYLFILFDEKYLTLIALALLLAEVPVNILMIKLTKYKEVDYDTYIQQVRVMMNFTFDYSNIVGRTGPCVYPAGSLYIFSLIYYVADINIHFTRYIFAGLYTLTLILVFRLYIKSKKVPPYVFIIFCCTSHRVHETYTRHMFNDCVAMLLLYLSLNLFLDNRWNWGSLVYSLAVSVKMNILLFSPVLLLTYWICLGFTGTLKQLSICAGIQLILGAPFLLTYPFAYLTSAFDLGRAFKYRWTVNWRFLPEYIFMNKYFHITLLVVHLLLLAVFYSTWKKYLTNYAQLQEMEDHIEPELRKRKKSLDESSAADLIRDHMTPESEKRNKVLDLSSTSDLFLTPMFTANLIGVACSRSLHMQFMVWYYHSIPYLLWSTKFPVICRIMILIVMELSWNTCCSTVLSSSALHICHVAILYGLYQNRHTQLSSLIRKIKNPECDHSNGDVLLKDRISTAVFLFGFVFYYFVFFIYLLYFWDSLSWFLPENFTHPYVCSIGYENGTYAHQNTSHDGLVKNQTLIND